MKDVAVVAFGRFNPTTIGHEKLLNAQKKIASKERGDMFVFMSQSQDAKKNPLEHSQKVSFAKKLMPEHATSIMKDKGIRTIFDMMKNIEDRGYERVIFVAGSDRVPEYQTLLGKYNGKDYTFSEITVVSAGDRDPDADGASGMSASKLRSFAKENDYESFRKGLPGGSNARLAKQIFNAVREGMNLKESTSMKSFKQFVSEEFPPKKDDGDKKKPSDSTKEREREKVDVGKEDETILVHPTPKEEENGEQDDAVDPSKKKKKEDNDK